MTTKCHQRFVLLPSPQLLTQKHGLPSVSLLLPCKGHLSSLFVHLFNHSPDLFFNFQTGLSKAFLYFYTGRYYPTLILFFL
ncbi:hypothetical protein XENOCAPTIV_016499, partial [Xenoophorus captivus]